MFEWAFKRIENVGFPVSTYSAGTGEVYDADITGLLEAGFKCQRGAFPSIKHETGISLWRN